MRKKKTKKEEEKEKEEEEEEEKKEEEKEKEKKLSSAGFAASFLYHVRILLFCAFAEVDQQEVPAALQQTMSDLFSVSESGLNP